MSRDLENPTLCKHLMKDEYIYEKELNYNTNTLFLNR